ncbi:MAG: lactate utilization protein [Solobacterium sp.]|nr:lactate utilization protein [Solobacterium sp.]
MDQNTEHIIRKQVEKTITKLRQNNFGADFFETKEDLLAYLKEHVAKGSTIGVGGSMTLFETGVMDWITGNEDYTFFDRYHTDDKDAVHHQVFNADVMFTSSQAITMDGMLYNVDGHGSRVAPLIYGPNKVYVIVGVNKLVKDLEEAIKRNECIAAPANNTRLNTGNPCVEFGECVHCNKERTICNQFVVTRRSGIKERIHVLFVNGVYGY